jgi:hypothetical protein
VHSPLPKSKTEHLLNGETDQTARAQLRSIVYERDRLQTEIKALRPAFARLSPISNLTEEGSCGPISEFKAEEPADLLTKEERRQIGRFLDPEFWYNEGFQLDEVRGLLSSSGRALATADFLHGLRKILGDRTQSSN